MKEGGLQPPQVGVCNPYPLGCQPQKTVYAAKGARLMGVGTKVEFTAARLGGG